MDTSLNSSLSLSKSKFSVKSPLNVSRRSAISNNYRKSSRFSTSGRSTQSAQVILKANFNHVERFGQPLPVLITEALTFSERNTLLTARISQLGFAWLVCGRRLLIWQYQQGVSTSVTPSKRQLLTGQCFELQLPQSDLAHRAELVSAFLLNGSSVPSCIAVSPEGVIRYWPSIAQEGVLVEEIVDLQGQECDSLTSVDGFGCILATTTCTIAIVQPQLIAGRHTLHCRTLKIPSGWLGGIGKRVSSFIFGPITSEHSPETRLVRVFSKACNDGQWLLYVSAGHSLQKWKLATNKPEQLIYMTDLNRIIREGFSSAVWENCSCDLSDLDIWLLDIGTEDDSVVILCAAVNLQQSPQVHYALITLPGGDMPPDYYQEFTVIKLTNLYNENNPNECLSYRLLMRSNSVYVYNQNTITVIRSKDEVETLDFNRQDFILGGSICVNTPIFFSRNNGLVAVSQNDMGIDFNMTVNQMSPLEASINDTFGNLTMTNLDGTEIYNTCKDSLSQMKAAFICHAKGQMSACEDILSELFSSTINCYDSVLDTTCVTLCEDFLNDVPARDPRWDSDSTPGLGSSYAMQIPQQLEDKAKCQNLFLNFLRENNLWNKLTRVTVRNKTMATVHVLGENSEKIVAAISLKSINTTDIIENAIDRVVRDYSIPFESNLTNQDLFYKNISTIYKALQEMVSICSETVHSDLGLAETAELIRNTNEVLLKVLKDVLTFRENNSQHFVPGAELDEEYLPWTAAIGSEGLADYLNIQQNLTCNYGARTTDDLSLENELYDQFVALVNIILDGRKSHLESITNENTKTILTRQYQTDRHKLIKPLIEDKQWERAALLAEKYLDFETLILICELTKNDSRLDEYMIRLDSEGFSEFVYSWYMRENKQGKLINRLRKRVKNTDVAKLNNFLSNHPSLSWMQNIFDKQFDQATVVLYDLGVSEKDSITRQKTILSFSKLARLAANGVKQDEFVDNINLGLELVQFQEDLPDYLLEHFGYDKNNPSVIPPKDLICLYICPEYSDATDMEFKKALDLLEHISDLETKNDMRTRIWKNVILRDSWTDKSLDSPMDVLKTKLFFKVAELSYILGADPNDIFPPLDTIIEDAELASLWNDKGFQFLLKAAYEHFANI